MKGIKSFYNNNFFAVFVIAVFCVFFVGLYNFKNNRVDNNLGIPNTEYGSFLAAQHALYINDFDVASDMLNNVKTDVSSVVQIKTLVDFLSGKIPENAKILKSDKDLANRLI